MELGQRGAVCINTERRVRLDEPNGQNGDRCYRSYSKTIMPSMERECLDRSYLAVGLSVGILSDVYRADSETFPQETKSKAAKSTGNNH